MRIPVTTALKIEDFAAGSIAIAVSQVVNGVFDQRADGVWYVTQRPTFNIIVDASATVSDAKGRGNYYWAVQSSKYFVNDYQVYKDSYGTPVNEASVTISDLDGNGTTATATTSSPHGYTTNDVVTVTGTTSFDGTYTITVTGASAFTFAHASSNINETGSSYRSLGAGGTGRVYFLEIATYLVILDPDNNTGWYIASGASTTLVKITDADFPSTLAMGGAVLNSRAYVMDEDGVIYGSDLEDPTSWDALNFLEAEYQPDGGVALIRQGEQIVAFGERTIEFFYDAGNPTGSPLLPRTDISHDIGMANEHSLWNESGILFFVGKTRSGEIAPYMMDGMSPVKIGTSDITSMVTSAVTTDSQKIVGCAFSIGGRLFYALTIYNTISSVISPTTTLVLNAFNQTWNPWKLAFSGYTTCPLVSWSESNATQIGEGMLANGDIVTLADDFNPQDLTLQLGIFVDGVFEPGVFSSSGGEGDIVEMEIITGPKDFGTRRRKVQTLLQAICSATDLSQNLTISTSDEDNNSWEEDGTLDLNDPTSELTQGGMFTQRNYKAVYAGDEQIELEGFEVEIEVLG